MYLFVFCLFFMYLLLLLLPDAAYKFPLHRDNIVLLYCIALYCFVLLLASAGARRSLGIQNKRRLRMSRPSNTPSTVNTSTAPVHQP